MPYSMLDRVSDPNSFHPASSNRNLCSRSRSIRVRLEEFHRRPLGQVVSPVGDIEELGAQFNSKKLSFEFRLEMTWIWLEIRHTMKMWLKRC